LPTDFSARIARNTQLYLQEETNICKSVDPLGRFILHGILTNEIAHKAWNLIEEWKLWAEWQRHRNRCSEDED